MPRATTPTAVLTPKWPHGGLPCQIYSLDLHNNGLGTIAPIFVVTPEYLLEEAVEGIPCAEKRGRFNSALQRWTVGVTSKSIATNPMEE